MPGGASEPPPPFLPLPRSGVRQRGGEIDESWFLCPFQLPGVAAAAASGGGSLEGDYSPFSFLHILGGFFPPFHMQDHDFTSFPRIGGDFLPFFPTFPSLSKEAACLLLTGSADVTHLFPPFSPFPHALVGRDLLYILLVNRSISPLPSREFLKEKE